jgi:hypothetical protein
MTAATRHRDLARSWLFGRPLRSCSWPHHTRSKTAAASGLEYQRLSLGLKRLIDIKGHSIMCAGRLACTAEELQPFSGWTSELSQEAERVWMMQEVRSSPQ